MKKITALGVLLVIAALVAPAAATENPWAIGTGDFAADASWSHALTTGEDQIIDNGGTAQLATAFGISPVDILSLQLGGRVGSAVGLDGRLDILEGGSLNTGNSNIFIGIAPGATGTLNVAGSASTLNCGTANIYCGYTNEGGVLGTTAYGHYIQSSNSSSAATCKNLWLAPYGGCAGAVVGIMDVNAGQFMATTGIGLGNAYDYDYAIPTQPCVGIIHNPSGAVVGYTSIMLGAGRAGYGYYALSGTGYVVQNSTGTGLNSNKNFYIGRYGYGVLDQTGGDARARTRFIIGGDSWTVPRQPAYGVYNLSGGTAESNYLNNTALGYYAIVGAGENGNGVLNISGTGSLEVKGNVANYAGLFVGFCKTLPFAECSGVVNLGAVGSGGGTLTTNFLQSHNTTFATVSGTLNFHGGTLKARSTCADFLPSATTYVYGEGAVIDTNGVDVGVATALQAPTGQGITGITLASAGTGYTAPPVVVISDTNFTSPGTGATAIAKVTTGGGLNIVMTNPGVGYADPLTVTVTLYGGDGSGAALGTGTVTTANNVSGGLTKKGLGMLTLSAANTYTGATTVEAGTLSLAATGSITSDVTIGNGAVLNVTGAVTGNIAISDGGTLGGAETLFGGLGTVTGDVDVSAGGTIAPGASPGKLTIAGDLDMAASANVTWDISSLVDNSTGTGGTEFDQILLQSGDLDLGTAAKLTLDFGLLAAADQPSADPVATFWTTSHQWKVIDVDATAGGTNTGGTDFATIAFTGSTPTKVVFDTLVGSGADLGDVFLTCAPGSPIQIPGDADGDGKVNDVDAKAVASNWGTTSGATWAMGDFNKDGGINAADASILAANGHYGVIEASGTVPEPSALVLLIALVTALLIQRRR